MDRATLQRQMDAIVQEDGPWTAHDIRIADGLSTFPKEPQWSADGVRRFLQIASDTCRKPWQEISLLDLGCLEGLYAIEAGLRGAKRAVGIDIRPQNIRKAEFAREALGLTNVSFSLDDVREMSAERYGQFDVIICSGILYHLDEQDPFHLIQRMKEMATGIVVIDTRISLVDERRVVHNGYEYRGCTYEEHDEAMDRAAQISVGTWASVGNAQSFWMTKSSLLTALTRAGFTTVMECHVPYLPRNPDRLTLVAFSGAKDVPHCTNIASASLEDWPE